MALLVLGLYADGAMTFAEPSQVAELTGPAQARWASTITCCLRLPDPGDGSFSDGMLGWELRRRGSGNAVASQADFVVLKALATNQRRDMFLQIELPPVPDPLGNLDGDFDLGLSIRTRDGKVTTLPTSHPIHVETRDSGGRVGGRYRPRNYDLVAANSAPARTSPDWLIETGIRHAREDCSWAEFEPKEGQWNDKAFGPKSRFGSLLLQHRRHDMSALPVILGIPEWAQARDKNGKLMGCMGPPADPAKFAAFVDRVVGYYSKPPYLQQDWQIWNEASGTTQTGFWTGGSWEQYVDCIHRPAASAIRRHYVDRNGNGRDAPGERCRVVYGGFPCSNWNDGSYAKVLELHGCGQCTDFLDAHYMQGLGWFERPELSGNVYSKWVASGKSLGCWQTEDGWDFAVRPTWLPYTYFHDLAWALSHDWSHKDKYREYFFHYYAAQPDHGFYWGSSKPKWPNGHSIRTFMRVTRGDLALPGPGRIIRCERDSAALPFCPILAGGRLVFLFKPAVGEPRGIARFAVALKPGEEIKGVSRVTLVQGADRSLPHNNHDGFVHFDLPWKSVEAVEGQMDDPLSPYCYVIVEGQTPLSPW